MKYLACVGLLLMIVSVSAVAEIIDVSLGEDPNIGFCATASSTTCGSDPNIVGTTSFGMWSFGAGNTDTPWYLLVSVPEASMGSATPPPAITSASFSLTLLSPVFYFDQNSASNNIYALTSGLTGLTDSNASMNKANMFGSVEQAYYGGTPTDFAVFVYSVSPGIQGKTAYNFSVASPGLTGGTFLAAIGVGGPQDKTGFSTPFTTSGLVNAPDGGMTLMLLGGALLGLETLRRKVRI